MTTPTTYRARVRTAVDALVADLNRANKHDGKSTLSRAQVDAELAKPEVAAAFIDALPADVRDELGALHDTLTKRAAAVGEYGQSEARRILGRELSPTEQQAAHRDFEAALLDPNAAPKQAAGDAFSAYAARDGRHAAAIVDRLESGKLSDTDFDRLLYQRVPTQGEYDKLTEDELDKLLDEVADA